MRGEALTTGRSVTRDFSCQLVQVDRKSVDPLAGKGEQEIRPVEPGNTGSPFLRDQAMRVPENRRCQENVFLNFDRRSAQGLVDIARKLKGKGRH